MRVLVTRAEPDAARTAALVRARGHEAVIAPVLALVDLPPPPLAEEAPAAILVTSARAVLPLSRHPDAVRLKAIPLLAVGDATAQAARVAGWTDVASAAGRLEDLVALASKRVPAGSRLLYAAGVERAGDLGGDLRRLGYTVDLVELYASQPAAAWPGPVVRALHEGAIDRVQITSRRSALAFLDHVRNNGLAERVQHLGFDVLSTDIAAMLQAAGLERVKVAARPDLDALMDLLPPVSEP